MHNTPLQPALLTRLTGLEVLHLDNCPLLPSKLVGAAGMRHKRPHTCV